MLFSGTAGDASGPYGRLALPITARTMIEENNNLLIAGEFSKGTQPDFQGLCAITSAVMAARSVAGMPDYLIRLGKAP